MNRHQSPLAWWCFLRANSDDATTFARPPMSDVEDSACCSSMSSDSPVPDRSNRIDRCIVTRATNLDGSVAFISATRSANPRSVDDPVDDSDVRTDDVIGVDMTTAGSSARSEM